MNEQPKILTRPDDISTVLGLDAKTRNLSTGKRIAGIAALIAVLAGLYFAFASSSSGPKTQYNTEPVTRGNLAVIVTATGTVEPTNQVDISSELSGTIRKVLVDFNDKVQVGQTLAELDTDKLNATADSSRAKVAAARAKVKDAEATFAEKQLDYNRKHNLFAKKISSEQDLDAAKAALERAAAAIESSKADVVAAAADLKLNETNLSKACICSPINGIVLARSVEPGQTVASSLQAPILFTIAEDLTKMEVQVDVDEADVGKVVMGQQATFSVDAYPERKFDARIRELHYGSQIVQGVVTYKAVLTADNSELLLRPGMTATAEISVQQVNDTLLVPNAALRFAPASSEEFVDKRSFLQKLMPGPSRRRSSNARKTNGKDGSTVYVLENGNAKKVPVKIGSTDGRFTQITEGDLQAGQAVILDTLSAK